VLVPVQRSSRVVIYEPSRRAKVGEIELSGYSGNPALVFRSADELWADDYDMLMRLDAADWRKLDVAGSTVWIVGSAIAERVSSAMRARSTS
jgi:hypothetical protein